MRNAAQEKLVRYLDVDLKDVLDEDQREEVLRLATAAATNERLRTKRDYIQLIDKNTEAVSTDQEDQDTDVTNRMWNMVSWLGLGTIAVAVAILLWLMKIGLQ